MTDINTILSKHFAGESSSEEEQLVREFKNKNSKEYLLLQSFWEKKNIKHIKFDSQDAWKEVASHTTNVKKQNPFYRYRYIAAAAALFLIALAASYVYLNTDSAQPMASITMEGQNQKLALEDGTVIFLNKDAQLSYPEKFDKNIREVTLEGEAFFEVAKDASRPFVIHAKHSDVEVLGTSFNVDANQKSTEVSVTTGKVKVQSSFTQKSVILLPEQSANATEKDLMSFQTEDENYLSWKTGEFIFEKMSLKDVVMDLNKFYDNKLVLKEGHTECQFTSSFKGTELEEIIEIIQLSCGLELTQKNGIYELF